MSIGRAGAGVRACGTATRLIQRKGAAFTTA